MLAHRLGFTSILLFSLGSISMLLVGLTHAQPLSAAAHSPDVAWSVSNELEPRSVLSPSVGLATLYLQSNWIFGGSYINGFAALSSTLFFAGYDV